MRGLDGRYLIHLMKVMGLKGVYTKQQRNICLLLHTDQVTLQTRRRQQQWQPYNSVFNCEFVFRSQSADANESVLYLGRRWRSFRSVKAPGSVSV